MSENANAAERCFECRLCDKRFSGPAPYVEHMQSVKHLKQKEKRELLDQFVNGRATTQHLSAPPTTDPAPSSNGMILDEIISKGLSTTLCDICHVPFMGPENALQHYRGKKHKKMEEKLELLRRLGGDAVRNVPSKSTDGASVDKKDTAPTPKPSECIATEKAEERSVEVDESSEPQKVVVRHAEGFGCKRCGIVLFADLASTLEHYESDYHSAKRAATE